MPSRVLRMAILSAAALVACVSLTYAASARDGRYAGAMLAGGERRYLPGYDVRGMAVGVGYRLYGHPLDDSYDPPFGYGEYAEYGPWAYRGYAGCQLVQRRVRTVNGLRWRMTRLCS